MKSANAYGRSSCAAHTALCADEPSSQISGRSGLPGSESPSLANGWSARQAAVVVREQLGELLREVVGRDLAPVALERVGGQRVGAGRAAEREVDPAGVQARPAG